MKFLLIACISSLAVRSFAQPTSPLKKYKIGDTAFCGIVFYVKDSTNGFQRGLVCSVQDVQTAIRWFNGSYAKTATTGDDLFNSASTIQIIQAQGAGTYAATVARNYTGGDSSCTTPFRWYLPSKAELLLLYTNLAKNKKVKFAKVGYWSSVESPQTSASGKFRQAWIVDFFNGKAFVSDKSNKNRVRAVKEFRNT